MKSTQKKMSKLSAEILQLEKSMAEIQEKLTALKKEKTEVENTEIVSLIRKANLSVDDIAELISDLKTVKKSNAAMSDMRTAEPVAADNILKGYDNQ